MLATIAALLISYGPLPVEPWDIQYAEADFEYYQGIPIVAEQEAPEFGEISI